MDKTKNRLSTAGRVTFSTLTLLVLLTVGLLATVYAQRVSPQKKSADNAILNSGSVGTAPESGSKVTLKLTFDNGTVFKVTQFEDAPIRITRHGSTIVLAAHLNSENLSEVHAKIFKVSPVETAGVHLGESIAEVGSLSLDIGREVSELNEGDLAFKIEVIQIAIDTKSTEERNKLSRVHLMSMGGGGVCCVTCSEITVCGCYVEGPCGSCCVGSCCT